MEATHNYRISKIRMITTVEEVVYETYHQSLNTDLNSPEPLTAMNAQISKAKDNKAVIIMGVM